MSDVYGAKVSQKGFDVRTCADYQLVYSSEWPLLKIESQGSVVIANATVDQVIYTHSLGYVPAFWAFDTGTYNQAYGFSISGSKIAFPGASQYIRMNGTDLKWMGGTFGAPAGAITIYYFVFRYNLATSFTAQIYNTSPAVGGTDNDYGIKISKPGFDVSNTDFRNFTIRSDCRSPMIHKTGTGTLATGIGGTVTIAHNLTYEPMFYFYAKIGAYGDSRYQMVTTADDSYVEADATNISMVLGYDCDYSYMIFKDPILLN